MTAKTGNSFIYSLYHSSYNLCIIYCSGTTIYTVLDPKTFHGGIYELKMQGAINHQHEEWFYVCVYVYAYICMYVYIYIYIYIFMSVCMCVHYVLFSNLFYHVN